jgi:hypothetical protein
MGKWAIRAKFEKSFLRRLSTRPAEPPSASTTPVTTTYRLAAIPWMASGQSFTVLCPCKRLRTIWTWARVLPDMSRMPELWIMRARLSNECGNFARNSAGVGPEQGLVAAMRLRAPRRKRSPALRERRLGGNAPRSAEAPFGERSGDAIQSGDARRTPRPSPEARLANVREHPAFPAFPHPASAVTCLCPY